MNDWSKQEENTTRTIPDIVLADGDVVIRRACNGWIAMRVDYEDAHDGVTVTVIEDDDDTPLDTCETEGRSLIRLVETAFADVQLPDNTLMQGVTAEAPDAT